MSGWYMPRDSGEWHYFPGEHESGINAGLSLCGATDDPGLGKVNAPLRHLHCDTRGQELSDLQTPDAA